MLANYNKQKAIKLVRKTCAICGKGGLEDIMPKMKKIRNQEGRVVEVCSHHEVPDDILV